MKVGSKSKEAVELLKAIGNHAVPGKDRGAAAVALRKLQASGNLEVSPEQRTDILWDFVVFGPGKEVVAEVHAEQDARYRYCATCFLKHEGETFAANACTRCGDQEWVKPSEIGNTGGPEGWVLRVSEDIGQMDREKLTHRLYVSSDNRDADIKIAKLVLRIFDAQGWEYPPEPYGSHNVIGGQFFLSQQVGPLPTPKVKVVPSAPTMEHLPEVPCNAFPNVFTAYSPGTSLVHPADEQVW